MKTPDLIRIEDLEVFYRVGVPTLERKKPQKLCLTLEMEADFSRAADTDDLGDTVDYFAVTQKLRAFGDTREWRLIERLAVDIADLVKRDFGVRRVRVSVKKYILPETRFVEVVAER